jgi:hypothetical protein
MAASFVIVVQNRRSPPMPTRAFRRRSGRPERWKQVRRAHFTASQTNANLARSATPPGNVDYKPNVLGGAGPRNRILPLVSRSEC